MKKLLVTAALGAMMISVSARAQTAAPPTAGDAQGNLTRQEALQRADRMFDRLDRNHDGVVTRAEAEAVRHQMSFASGKIERKIDKVFGQAASITRQQFEAQAIATFDREDLNHDGVLTPDERAQVKAQKAQRAAAARPPQ